MNGVQKKKLGWACGIPACGCLVILLIPVFLAFLHAWIYRPYDLQSEKELKAGYEAEFLTLPPPGVQVLKGRQIIIWDSGGQYLLIKMTPEEIDRHIAKGFKRVANPPNDFKNLGQGNRPSWWIIPLSGTTEYYENWSWTTQGGWGYASAFMAVDRTAGMVWLSCHKG